MLVSVHCCVSWVMYNTKLNNSHITKAWEMHNSTKCSVGTFQYIEIWLCHVHREWALLSFHSVCLSGCLSVIPRPTVYHDWSITTKFGRQVIYLSSDPCKPFWIPYLPCFRRQMEKYAKFRLFPTCRQWVPGILRIATANVTHCAIWLVLITMNHIFNWIFKKLYMTTCFGVLH